MGNYIAVLRNLPLICALSVCSLVAGCRENGPSKPDYDQVFQKMKAGMTLSETEAILGSTGQKCDEKDWGGGIIPPAPDMTAYKWEGTLKGQPCMIYITYDKDGKQTAIGQGPVRK